MEATEGECRTGASIGPICSSIMRVSRNSSASGMSRQPKRGLPISTEIIPSSRSSALMIPAIVSKVNVLRPVSAESALHNAAHAVAASLCMRAIGIQNLDVILRPVQTGVVNGHDLVEAHRRIGIESQRCGGTHPVAAPRMSATMIALPRPFIFANWTLPISWRPFHRDQPPIWRIGL